MANQHLVTVQHDYGNTKRGCRAFCNTCLWSGNWVKFVHTAQRHAEQHRGDRRG